MASDFDISRAAASIYAESIFQLAEETGQEEQIGEEMQELQDLWERDTSFAKMMSSAAIDAGARRESIRRIFGPDRVSRLVLNLLFVLNDKRRSMILPAVCDAYRRRLNEKQGREEVYVTTAVPLEKHQRESIRKEIKRLTGRDADFYENVDPDVLGGVTVRAADKLYDMSIRRRLREMRAGLLAASEKHLLGDVSRFVTEG